MTFDDFVSTYNGKQVETEDSTNLYQCMDLAFAWCDARSIPRETIRCPNAYQVWTQPVDSTILYFDYIPNTPMGVPQQGDLVVFTQGVGPSGHISIASGKGDPKGFTSFDQNWAGVQSAQLVDHTYADVYGWLHQKQPTVVDTFLPEVARVLQVSADEPSVMTKLDSLVASEQASIAKDQQIQAFASQINALQGQPMEGIPVTSLLSEANSIVHLPLSQAIANKAISLKPLLAVWDFLKGKKTIIIGLLMVALGLLQNDTRLVLEGCSIIGLRAAVLGSGIDQTSHSVL